MNEEIKKCFNTYKEEILLIIELIRNKNIETDSDYKLNLENNLFIESELFNYYFTFSEISNFILSKSEEEFEIEEVFTDLFNKLNDENKFNNKEESKIENYKILSFSEKKISESKSNEQDVFLEKKNIENLNDCINNFFIYEDEIKKMIIIIRDKKINSESDYKNYLNDNLAHNDTMTFYSYFKFSEINEFIESNQECEVDELYENLLQELKLKTEEVQTNENLKNKIEKNGIHKTNLDNAENYIEKHHISIDINKELQNRIDYDNKLTESALRISNLEHELKKMNNKNEELQSDLENLKVEFQEKKEIKKKLKEEKEQKKKVDDEYNQKEAKNSDIKLISRNSIKIEFRILFPFENNNFGSQLLKYLGIDKLNSNLEQNSFITCFLDNLLSKRTICELPNQFECDIVPIRCREDKFGIWKYDYLFDLMKIVAVFKDKNTFFPSYWKINKEQNTTYEFSVLEFEQHDRASVDENMPIREFFSYLGEKTTKKIICKEILTTFKKQDVKTVKDLINIKLSCPETFNKYFSIKFEIFEELENISSQNKMKNHSLSTKNSKDFFKEAKKQIDYQARVHKILRYFYFTQDKYDEIGFLDSNVINSAYQCIKKDFLNEDLLSKIKDFYFPMTTRPEHLKVKLPRGVLFYGPPGTGKTTVAVLFPDLIGLTAICTPLASTELNRSLVGETEQIITQICERAHNYPHLICYVSIDEIDAMVPRRDDKENKNKGDTVNTLLSLIGGIKDVPNLVFVASTNYIKKIDEAFSRRMSGKFFVGRMDPEARQHMLFKVNEALTKEKVQQKIYAEKNQINKFESIFNNVQIQFNNDLNLNFNKKDEKNSFIKLISNDKMDKINVALINFTPAAMENLATLIKNEAYKTKSDFNQEFDFSPKTLLELALIAAKQINIKFGTFYIPELYLTLNLYENMGLEAIDIPIGSLGLVIVDLYMKVYNFKTQKMDKEPKMIFSEKKIKTKKIITNLNDIIDQICSFSLKNKIHTMQLIDLPSLINNQAFEEQKILENINEIISELKEYPNSLLVIDIDSLISTTVSESQSSMGPSKSLGLNNVKLFYYIRDLANTCPYIKYDSQGNIQSSFWMFLVGHEKYLLSLMKESLYVEKSEEESKREEERNKKENEVLKCVRCEKNFFHKDNKSLDVCNYHMGYVFDSSKSNDEWELLNLLDDKDKMKIDLKLILCQNENKGKSKENDEEDDKSSDESDDEENKEPNGQNPFKYVCCRRSYNEQGCKNSKHLDTKDRKIFDEERNKIKWEKELEKLKNIID